MRRPATGLQSIVICLHFAFAKAKTRPFIGRGRFIGSLELDVVRCDLLAHPRSFEMPSARNDAVSFLMDEMASRGTARRRHKGSVPTGPRRPPLKT
jgi:hypothetical protein